MELGCLVYILRKNQIIQFDKRQSVEEIKDKTLTPNVQMVIAVAK